MCALALYIGDAGFRCYWCAAHWGGFSFIFNGEIERRCLFMRFVCKEELAYYEEYEACTYAKEHGVRFSGKNAFPQFVKYEPYCVPRGVEKEEDIEALCDALEAACLLTEILKTRKPKELELHVVDEDSAKVPLFEVRDGRLVVEGFTDLPKDREAPYEFYDDVDQEVVDSVRKLPQNGVWEAELITFPMRVWEKIIELPYYPAVLAVVEKEDGYLLPTLPIEGTNLDAQEVVRDFAKAWESLGSCAKEIRCSDKRTYAVLRDFCEKAEIDCSV